MLKRCTVWFENQSILRKNICLLSVLAIVLAALASATFLSVLQSQDALKDQRAALERMAKVDAFRIQFASYRYHGYEAIASLTEESRVALHDQLAVVTDTIAPLQLTDNREAWLGTALVRFKALLESALEEFVLEEREAGLARLSEADQLIAEIEALLDEQDKAVSSAVSLAATTVDQKSDLVRLLSIIVLLTTLTASALIVSALQTFIARPIRAISSRLDALSKGDVRSLIPGEGRGDEVGVIANAVGGFRDNLKEVAELRKRQDEAASARERRSQAFEEAVSRFATRTNTQTTAMAEALGHLDVVSEQMNASNESLNQQSSGIAQASEASSSAVEGVAQATGHLGGSIKEIAASAANQRERAEHALSDIVRSSDFVTQLVESVRRVESVVELIGSIAEQTNLLALNATIESARAGEAGKGFAVVAAEIRELANQTAKATEEIEGLVEDIDARSTATSEANQTVHDHIKDMNRLAADVADAVQSQSMSSSDIIRSMNDAAQSARTITASIRDVADTTDMSLAAANKVTHAAVSLRNRIDEMQTSIDVMLKEVRAL